jgi:hypothetical protein
MTPPGDPATRRPRDPATRRPGDPATRRPGDPAQRPIQPRARGPDFRPSQRYRVQISSSIGFTSGTTNRIGNSHTAT